MSKLLAVQSAQFPLLILETILLGVAPTPAPPQAKPSSVEIPAAAEATPRQNEKPLMAPKPQLEPQQKAEPKTAATIKPPTNNKASATTHDVLEKWPEILEATKQKNNPLYTVLRLATPEVTQDGLVLIFGFPFHQKKVDEVKYKTLIASVVQELTNQNLVITTIVDKARVRPAPTPASEPAADPAHASLISDVQDMMGGGEVVNV
jgi:hypothetical protein